MSASTDALDDFVQEAMRRFLTSPVTGCEFAMRHAAKERGRLLWTVVKLPATEVDAVLVDGLFDVAAADQKAAIVVFPNLRTSGDLVQLVETLAQGTRWRIQLPQWKKHARGDVLVGLSWKTKTDKMTSVMGLGPLGTMPIHRRAPFFALAAWTGDHANEYRSTQERKPGRVSLLDMPPPIGTNENTYKERYDKSLANSEAFRVMTNEGAARHDVAFCMPPEHASRLKKLVKT